MNAMLRAAIMLMVLLSGGCAALFAPREVVLPLPRLQQQLASRFPQSDRYLALVDVTLSRPRLALLPDANRVEFRLATTFVPVLTNQAWNGSLALSGSLRVDPGRQALVLAQPRVEHFALDGVEGQYAAQLSRFGGLLAQQLLTEVPLYRFAAADFRHAGVDFTPVQIVVKPDALVVTFEPVE